VAAASDGLCVRTVERVHLHADDVELRLLQRDVGPRDALVDQGLAERVVAGQPRALRGVPLEREPQPMQLAAPRLRREEIPS
jgi:hypothetical protein